MKTAQPDSRCVLFAYGISAWLFFGGLLLASPAFSADPWPQAPDADALLREYFKQEVEVIHAKEDLTKLTTPSQWIEQKPRLREELLDMLGLWPRPEKSDLQATTVGIIERDGVIVERVHFQSLPGVYVTANLYRPVEIEKPLPGVLYVCGHSAQHETIDGKQISYGNKTGYQRHGAWLARHGFVCLTIDTVQWGEFLGQHWGTYRQGRWDWLSRGYTPAGIEAWNGVRALDYLTSRPEVDAEKIGVTGRSGGGAYSWFIAAIDDRVDVAIPVAGITDLENHVVDDCIEGHCDCMFFVNYYRWDYPKLAAMIAPRPLLIANSDNDTIFPLDGVIRTANQVKHIYQMLGANDQFGIMITPGPHKDTPELQLGAFRWLQRHLQGLDVPVDEAAIERFDRRELKVFDQLPVNERVTTADIALSDARQLSELTTDAPPADVFAKLRKSSFSGWPTEPSEMSSKRIWSSDESEPAIELWELRPQTSVVLWALIERGTDSSGDASVPLHVHLADSAQWAELEKKVQESTLPASPQSRITLLVRGVGPLAWTPPKGKESHVPRRFYLLGQTVDAMRTWDTLRTLDFARQAFPNSKNPPIVTAADSLQPVVFYAAALADTPFTIGEIDLPDDYLAQNPLIGAGRIRGLNNALRSLRMPPN